MKRLSLKKMFFSKLLAEKKLDIGIENQSNVMKNNEIKILVVDDEPDILEFMQYNLEKEDFKVSIATNGREAIETAMKVKPDLIILDIMMPELDGVEVCRELRSMPTFNDTLIAFLTARNEDYSQIAGFEVGGDDYITKPIRPRVLLSRIKALLRRSRVNDGLDSSMIIKVGNLVIDKEKIVVYKDENAITLAKKEFELLCLLASKPGKVFSRQSIYEKVWGTDVIVGNRTIDVHIRKLREKIGDGYIKTIKGIGYKFDF